MAAIAALLAAAPAAVADAPALTPLHATRGDAPAVIDGAGRHVLLRGVNVNQLGDYYRANPALDPVIPLTEDDFDAIASLGFDSVRLLVHWSALEPVRGAFDEAYVARIRQAVGWAKQRGLYTVLDMHQDAWGKHVDTPPDEQCAPGFARAVGWDGAPEWATFTDGMPTCRAGGVRELSFAVAQAWQSFWADRDGIQGRLVATWARLAREFAAEPAVAGYDLINEPNPGYTVGASGPTFLSELYARSIEAIRAAEREAPGGFAHVVFFEPLVVWSATGVDTVPPPSFTDDPNVVFAPHLYAGSISLDSAAGAPFLTPREGHEFAAEGASTYGTTYWSGEWGWFGDPKGDRPRIADYAREEDARLVGGAWWSWKQSCGDPHQISEPGGAPLGVSPSLNRFGCPENRPLGIPATTRRILARGYPRAAPGRLTALESDPETGALRVAGRDEDPDGSCELVAWLPGGAGRPALDGRNVSAPVVKPFAGGWLASACAAGEYELRTSAAAGGGGAGPAGGGSANPPRCLSARSTVGHRSVGRVRLGDTRGRALRRARSAPASTTAYAYRWCVKGSARRVVAVFAGRAEGDRMVLAATSAAAHAKRGVAPGATRARLLRAFPRARRVASGVYAGGPTSRHVFGVRSGRVAFVAVAERALLDEPARLRRALRRAGL
ncbi:MAG TPA: cellulase family glycosylhydrolase [Thermoleophilaceae bacterium]|jgi:endoglycosylceramidase